MKQRIKYKILISLVVFMIYTVAVFAAGNTMLMPVGGEAEITSDFGWREHPIFGTQKFHSGIDIVADEGQPIYASSDGIVASAGWLSGYGFTVIIDHGEGLESLYAHNSEVLVWEGNFVKQGTVIALAGSTGNSTGPHCHFEVDLDGEPMDPWLYLSGAARPSTNPMNFLRSDYNFLPIDFDASVDFAKPLRDTLTSIVKACTDGLSLLQKAMGSLFWGLVIIDFAYSALWGMFKTNYNPNTGQQATAKGYVHWLLQRVIFYGVLAAIVFHWQDWFINFVLTFFTDMGSNAMGSSTKDVGAIVSDPTKIVQKGVSLIAPAFSYIGGFSGPAALLNLQLIIPT